MLITTTICDRKPPSGVRISALSGGPNAAHRLTINAFGHIHLVVTMTALPTGP